MKKKILFAASEALPFAASGGLGDVIGSLPAALMKDHGDKLDVRVVMPLYKSIRKEFRDKMTEIDNFDVKLAWRTQYCGILTLKYNGVTFYFIDNEYYFARESLYGSFDDGERYAFFCKALLEMLPVIDFWPDILHAHDWQSALSVIYLKRKYGNDERYANIKSIFTIHNIEYQGKYSYDILWDVFELMNEDKNTVDYSNCINLMKGAIICADKVTTVSPHYSKEIMTPYYSHGMHYILIRNAGKVSGIINGIDYDYYDPSKDPDVYVNYSADSPLNKAENKKLLLRELGLPVSDAPLIAMITRLTTHKGLDLVSWAAENLLSRNVQLAVLGTGEPGYEAYFTYLKNKFPDKVSVTFRFDKAFSKKLYAGADMFLMPSKSEPCGLSQMIASRYGTVPIVRQTGGLCDTIHENDNGFTFYAYNGDEMLYAITRAIDEYNDREKWNALVGRCMNKDFSWASSAKEYVRLYTD